MSQDRLAAGVKLIKRVLMAVVVFIATLYVCDYISVRYRIPGNRDPLGSVKIQPYYAVPQKNRNTEFIFTDPQTKTCVHSLFPHLGYPPCWYLSRKKTKRIDV